MYAKVENGQVIQVGLPKTGMLNGHTISGYYLLPESVLFTEGWLPLEENKPEYNLETQSLKLINYIIESEKVIANYDVINLPEPEPMPHEIKIMLMGLSGDFMSFMDWYFMTHPEET